MVLLTGGGIDTGKKKEGKKKTAVLSLPNGGKILPQLKGVRKGKRQVGTSGMGKRGRGEGPKKKGAEEEKRRDRLTISLVTVLMRKNLRKKAKRRRKKSGCSTCKPGRER